LNHSWLKEVKTNAGQKFKKVHIHKQVMENLRMCKTPSGLLYEILVLFCQFLDDADIQAILETFQTMDDDDSGTITTDELQKVYME